MEPPLVCADSRPPPAVQSLQSVRCLQKQKRVSHDLPVAALCAELLSSSPEEVTDLTVGSYKIAEGIKRRVFLFLASSESFRDICVMLECFLGDGGVSWARVEYIVMFWQLPGDETTYLAQQFVITECYIKSIIERSPKLRLLLLPFGLVAGPASIGAAPTIKLPPTGLGNLDQLTRLLSLLYDSDKHDSPIQEVLGCLDRCFGFELPSSLPNFAPGILALNGGHSQAIKVVDVLYDLISNAYNRPVVAGRGRFLESLLSSPKFPFPTPISADVWKEELETGLLDNLARHQHLHSLYIGLTGESLGSWTFTNLEELGITVELPRGMSTYQRFEFIPRTVPNCPNLRTLRITRIAGTKPSNLEKMNYSLAASVSRTFDSMLVGYTSNGETHIMLGLNQVYVDRYCAWRRVGQKYGLPPATMDTAAVLVPVAHERLDDRL